MTDELLSITDVATAFGIPVSTLRYYDEIGLLPAPHRRSRVRHYDRAALKQLVYVQLWRQDGMLGLEDTATLVAGLNRVERNELLQRSRDELTDRIRRLQDAEQMLAHLMYCPNDDHLACPITSTYLDDRVDAALHHLTGGPRPSLGAAWPVLRRLAEALKGPFDEQPATDQPIAGDRADREQTPQAESGLPDLPRNGPVVRPPDR